MKESEITEDTEKAVEQSSSAVDPSTKALEQYLEQARDAVNIETQAFFEALYKDFWSEHESTWMQASELHHQTMLVFTDILDPDSPLTWSQTINYRRSVHRQIFLKLPAALTPSPYSKIESHLKKYLNRVRHIASTFPEVLEVPENPALFSNHPNRHPACIHKKVDSSSSSGITVYKTPLR